MPELPLNTQKSYNVPISFCSVDMLSRETMTGSDSYISLKLGRTFFPWTRIQHPFYILLSCVPPVSPENCFIMLFRLLADMSDAGRRLRKRLLSRSIFAVRRGSSEEGSLRRAFRISSMKLLWAQVEANKRGRVPIRGLQWFQFLAGRSNDFLNSGT
ncbi:uncharacterized protein FOMMEDRAFT_16241 [Fomitiporia mediterranea MF3/22]|uniref:uncharacterized protein n=1 Tax=Fomitiporia mediterranea (strain MF3/22) TaxID=694068 RepID=UPI00044095AF|nr:uncharacterized protein FOMMEDRAFT_16241 [Fomitiporia mediterranea MF3/22]EJD07592.1 hypothetical protein FOMMEDRAFT_16241 [Fomitiporia mediterranea MF3/22]